MSALDRIDQIRADAQAVNAVVFRSQSSFDAMLEAAVAGGPRLDVPSDPRAVAIQAGTTTREEVEAQADAAARSVLDDLGGTPSSGEADEVGAAPASVPDEAGSWSAGLPERGQEWAAAIEAAATRHGLEPELLGALVWSESAFDPQAVSSAGAIGLAQLMPGTAAGLGVDPTDPLQNLEGGARYLRQQLDRFGTFELGLAAYNAGPTRVAQAGGIPAIAETQAYVQVVLDRYVQLGGLR
ncbi:MAG: lytic transglycosylase domain-containing protein [Actinomycetota bacterium]